MNAKLAGLFLGLGMSVAATADTYHFTPITDTSTLLQDLGNQLTLDVTDGGTGNVLFTFTNPGSIPSTIAQVYFDDAYPASPSLFSGLSAAIAQSAGVSTELGATPPVLPGGNGTPFQFTPTASVGAIPPPPTNGVNNSATPPVESLTLSAVLNNGVSFANVISSLNGGNSANLTDPINQNFLRVGLHVISIGENGSSASFLDTPGGDGGGAAPPPPIPEPGTYGMLLAGLGLLAALTRRRLTLPV